MSGLIVDCGKKIRENILYASGLVIVVQFILINFSLPLHWFAYLVAGFIFWQHELESYPKVFLTFLAVPFGYSFYLANPSVLIFTVSMVLQGLVIYVLRRSNSWSFLVELVTIFLLLMLAFFDIYYPDVEQLFIKYVADMQNLKPEDVIFVPGAMLVGLGAEVMILSWLASRWANKVVPLTGNVMASANNVRVSMTMLAITILLPLSLYVSQVEVVSYGYILSLPYTVAGISLLSWGYKTYKKNKKDSGNSFILLIFILLYATLIPLALGFLGLLDIGLNLRKKYESYLKRR